MDKENVVGHLGKDLAFLCTKYNQSLGCNDFCYYCVKAITMLLVKYNKNPPERLAIIHAAVKDGFETERRIQEEQKEQ